MSRATANTSARGPFDPHRRFDPHCHLYYHAGEAWAPGWIVGRLDRPPTWITRNSLAWGTQTSGATLAGETESWTLVPGGGMDSFLSANWVGEKGRVIGVDMTVEMVDRARTIAGDLHLGNLEFEVGLIEDLPIESGWADVVISNGVITLCPDKFRVYEEIHRVLKPDGRMTIADICVERPVPESALGDIDLWTG